MSPTSYAAILATPFGALGVRLADGAIAEIRFLPPGTAPQPPADPMSREACRQLAAYLADPDAGFDLPLAPAGTAFQQRVWQAIRAIPRGKTRSYGEIARLLGSAARAVGQACGANPYPIVVPCHRVVGSGELGGFAHARAGDLIDTKRWLLAHEGAL